MFNDFRRKGALQRRRRIETPIHLREGSRQPTPEEFSELEAEYNQLEQEYLNSISPRLRSEIDPYYVAPEPPRLAVPRGARPRGPRRAARRSTRSSAKSGDSGSDGPGEPPAGPLRLAPPPRAVMRFGCLPAAERGADIEQVQR